MNVNEIGSTLFSLLLASWVYPGLFCWLLASLLLVIIGGYLRQFFSLENQDNPPIAQPEKERQDLPKAGFPLKPGRTWYIRSVMTVITLLLLPFPGNPAHNLLFSDFIILFPFLAFQFLPRPGSTEVEKQSFALTLILV